ncbi:hypothetical protein P691DRAFT_785258 [Macrolepiota fuliginosa MF-IS2]|uniref:Uncharacterized protein n=1 Tax=Macrolepiota fuliginosa MF-IS2 TaxID=1400762 RepID=A0A9P5WVY2_9AGAR|nr:hypothetical protein P691DRAFT_785258 [Macrolepiota fuliginosa MF-IS2]
MGNTPLDDHFPKRIPVDYSLELAYGVMMKCGFAEVVNSRRASLALHAMTLIRDLIEVEAADEGWDWMYLSGRPYGFSSERYYLSEEEVARVFEIAKALKRDVIDTSEGHCIDMEWSCPLQQRQVLQFLSETYPEQYPIAPPQIVLRVSPEPASLGSDEELSDSISVEI